MAPGWRVNAGGGETVTFEEDLYGRRVIPVVAIRDEAHAEILAAGLVAGGLPIAEVTLRTQAAPAVIRALAKRNDVLVGAGTVCTARQVDEACDAGAKFLVSPGLSKAVVARAQERGVPILPGAVTATEIMAAQELGLETLKFFPAGTSGGPGALKAFSAPFAGVRFVPTGGIGTANLQDYLSLPNVVAVGGSWMVPGSALEEGNPDVIAELSREAVDAALPAHS